MEFTRVSRYIGSRELAAFTRDLATFRSGEHLMRTIIAFLLGIAVTIGAAYVHDTATAGPSAKPLVNWDQLGDVTRDLVDAVKTQWSKLTK
jgi:hypothetical protein